MSDSKCKKNIRIAFILLMFFTLFKTIVVLASYFELLGDLPREARSLFYLTPAEVLLQRGHGIKLLERIVFVIDILSAVLMFFSLLTDEKKARIRFLLLPFIHTLTYVVYIPVVLTGIMSLATHMAVLQAEMAAYIAGLMPAAALIFIAKGFKGD